MSTYGSTAAVVIQPYIATQEFRDTVHAALPSCLSASTPTAVTAESIGSLLTAATHDGRISQAEAMTSSGLISRAQRAEVAHAAAQSLVDLGFQVRLASGATTSLWAERQHQVMAVEVHDGGGFEFDLAGIEGHGCQTIVADFVTAMADRGIQIQPSVQSHNDPRGGQLVRRVARQASPRPAQRRSDGLRQAQ